MKSEEIKTVAVIGAGAMGQQIAMNAALNCRGCQYRVYLCDSFLNAVEKAKKWAGEYLAGRVLKGRISQERANEVAENLIITSDIDQAVKQADLIMEAIIEKLDTKREVLRYISQLCKARRGIRYKQFQYCQLKAGRCCSEPKETDEYSLL